MNKIFFHTDAYKAFLKAFKSQTISPLTILIGQY